MAEDRSYLSPGVLLVGTGLLAVGGYFWWKDWTHQKLVEEYISEAQELRAYYDTAVADGDYTPEEMEGVALRQNQMDAKEKELEREGLIVDILDHLARLGIIVSAGYIAAKIVEWLLRNRPPTPPAWQCPVEGSSFSTETDLYRHLEEVHGIVPEGASEAYNRFRNLPKWMQDLVRVTSGVGNSINTYWDQLPLGTQLAIILALLTLIAISGGLFSPLAPALRPIASLMLV